MVLKKVNSIVEHNLQNIKEKVIEEYKVEIENNFKIKKFNFANLKKKEYKDILCEYLNSNGYGYAYKNILNLENTDDIDIGYYLFTSGLIEDIKIELVMMSLNKYKVSDKKYKIKYKETEGLNLNIKISYNSNLPIKIETLDIGENEFLNYKISGNDIYLNINIEENMKINSIEKVIIYRSYGIDTFELNIECQPNKKKYKDLYDFNDYLLLCKEYKEKAIEIYKKKDFHKWLEETEYVQFINYNKADKLSKETSQRSFDLFCAINGIKKENYTIQDDNNIRLGEKGPVNKDDEFEVIKDGVANKNKNEKDVYKNQKNDDVYKKQKNDSDKYDKEKNDSKKEGIVKKIINIIFGKFGRKRK